MTLAGWKDVKKGLAKARLDLKRLQAKMLKPKAIEFDRRQNRESIVDRLLSEEYSLIDTPGASNPEAVKRLFRLKLQTAIRALKLLPEEMLEKIRCLREPNKFIMSNKGDAYDIAARFGDKVKREIDRAGGLFISQNGKVYIAEPKRSTTIIIHEIAHAFHHANWGFDEAGVGVELYWMWKKNKGEFREYGQKNELEGFATGMEVMLLDPVKCKRTMPNFYKWCIEYVWKGDESWVPA